MRPGHGEKPEAWIPETWCIVNRWPDNEQKENQPYTQQGDEGSGNTRWTQLGWIDIITQNEAKLDMLNTGRGAVKNNRNKLWPDTWLDTGRNRHGERGNRNGRWNNNTTGTRSEGHREREGDTEGERHDGLGRTHVEARDRRGRHGMKHERDMRTGEETLRETRTWLRNIHRGHDRLTQETRNWTAARKPGTDT